MGNLRGKTTDGFLTPLGIPQLSCPPPPSYFTSLRTGSYSYAAASHANHERRTGTKRKDWRHRCTSEPSWKMRAMNTAGHGILRIRLRAPAVRSAYIPMRWGTSGTVPPARSRPVAALIHSHPCGGRMAYLMERECRIHKDREPQGSSPYAAVAGATFPSALHEQFDTVSIDTTII